MRRHTVAVVVVLVVMGLAGPAVAHPFGPPPTALVTARGNSVFIEWTAAPDDTLAIGVQIGLMPQSVIDDVMEASVQIAPSRAQEELLNNSPELKTYLTEHIAVEQAGTMCEPTVQPIDDFVSDGARVVYQCPEQITEVAIEITMLHDVHEAYRTFAVTNEYARPTQAVYSVDTPRHTWDFSVNPDTQSARQIPPWAPLLVIGGFVGLVALFVVIARSEGDRVA